MSPLLVAVLLGTPSPPAPVAPPWGNDGHRIVCEIAWHYLRPVTRRRVMELLPPGEYETFPEACTWPDRYARGDDRFEWLRPRHYIDVDIRADAVRIADENCPGLRDCVLAEIDRARAQLEDPDESEEYRVNALRILGHLVGDLHQPLHVSHRDDCGGCRAHPTYDGTSSRTMHSLWDTDFIEDVLDERYGRAATERWDEWAFDLRDGLTLEERRVWTGSVPLDWAQESLSLAQDESFFRYGDGDRLPADYLVRATPVIERRLAQAGVRLAQLLNDIFDD